MRNTVRGWTLLWSILSGAGTHDEMMFGLGGVMLESTDWRGGLRDRALVPHDEDCLNVDTEISKVVEALKRHVFPLHGL